MSDNLAIKLTPSGAPRSAQGSIHDASSPLKAVLAPSLEAAAPVGAVQEFGAVLLAEGGGFLVRTASGEQRARRAVSCLVEPEPNDRVLVTYEVGAKSEGFILAVLDRKPGAAATLAHDGDVNIRLNRGRLAVVAQGGVGVVTGQDVSVVSGAVKMTASEGELSLDRLTVLSSLVRAEIGKAKVFGESIETIASRMTQRVKRAFRFVEEIDQLKTKRLDYTAEEVAQIHAGNAVVTAEQLVKVDGEQIHLG